MHFNVVHIVAPGDETAQRAPVEDRDMGPDFVPAPASELLQGIFQFFRRGTNYDVSRDGKRVLVPRAVSEDSTDQDDSLRVVLNWLDEVQRRMQDANR